MSEEREREPRAKHCCRWNNRSDASRAPSLTRIVSDGSITLNPPGIESPMSAVNSG